MNYLLYNPLADNGNGVENKNKAIIDIKKVFNEFTEMNVLELNIEE